MTIVGHSGLGDFPPHAYQLQLQERLMRPVLTVLLMMLGVAFAQLMPRRRSVGLFIAAGAMLGVAWWLIGEVIMQVGELGLLPPVLAAWVPAILAVLVLRLGSAVR